MGFLSNLFKSTDYKALMQNGAIIVDVRSKGEYSGGKIKNSTNIPLDTIDGQIERLKKLNKPIITCCASGMRSGLAKDKLKAAGIEVYNGGGWSSLNSKI